MGDLRCSEAGRMSWAGELSAATGLENQRAFRTCDQAQRGQPCRRYAPVNPQRELAVAELNAIQDVADDDSIGPKGEQATPPCVRGPFEPIVSERLGLSGFMRHDGQQKARRRRTAMFNPLCRLVEPRRGLGPLAAVRVSRVLREIAAGDFQTQSVPRRNGNCGVSERDSHGSAQVRCADTANTVRDDPCVAVRPCVDQLAVKSVVRASVLANNSTSMGPASCRVSTNGPDEYTRTSARASTTRWSRGPTSSGKWWKLAAPAVGNGSSGSKTNVSLRCRAGRVRMSCPSPPAVFALPPLWRNHSCTAAPRGGHPKSATDFRSSRSNGPTARG